MRKYNKIALQTIIGYIVIAGGISVTVILWILMIQEIYIGVGG